ncbi:hypothetical protein MNBD_NITROSPINAE02-1047 [hydrothermal vent metagenome]|uniref:COG1399 protein, clustered with ribosomal protein L32p n=1 Tax=hydrothermal vent metagenome TaxID=652676 RepID=A0A3B1C5W2_9ZZZZ
MIYKREDSLKIKVVKILEDELEREWKAPARMFSEDLSQIDFLGPVIIGGTLSRMGMNVNFEGWISGMCELECSLCLKKYEFPLKGEIAAIFVPSEKEAANAHEIELNLTDIDTQFYDGDEIDIYEPVRDHIALSVPMRPLCGDACKGLCHVCGANLNEKECGCDRSSGDPRLAVLKRLKFD